MQQGDPIEQRYKEHSERGSAVEQLLGVINAYRQAAASGDSKYEHIDLNEKQKVLIVKSVFFYAPFFFVLFCSDVGPLPPSSFI